MALSCDKHTAYLYDRGGLRQIGALTPLSRVRYTRKRDDISEGVVYIQTPSAACSQALAIAEAGRHEIVIFRGTERVWEGPITLITYERDSVTINAKDVMYYANRTIMHAEYDNRYPRTTRVLDRLDRIMRAELSRKESLDPPINVLPYLQFLYADGSRTYERSYFDTTAAKAGISKATTIDEMVAACDGVRSAYGLTTFGLAGFTSIANMSWKQPRISDWQLRQYMISALTALSLYPPAYIIAAGVKNIYFVRDIQMGTNFNVGGGAYIDSLYMDIVDYANAKDMVFGSDHILNHELNHIQRNTFGDTLIKARWLSLNPAGFSYGGNWQAQDYSGLNPPGFIRDYSRYAFEEDLAEVAGAVMTPSMQPLLTQLLSTDATLAAKVALYKEWMKANSNGLIDNDAYYKALSSGTIVLPGTDGITDARTAARTLPYEMTLFDHIDNYAARGGIDYAVVGRRILLFDVHKRIGQTAMVTGDDFIGDPVITQYGSELTTYVAMTDGKGNYGDAGGIDPYYGEWEMLHQAYDENAGPAATNVPPSTAEMKSQAIRTQAQGKVPPLVVRIPDNTQLNPNGVLQLSDLVPGVWIPLSASLSGRTVSQMQKLDSMSVEETAQTGEQIKVVLSPGYTETFVEDTP